MPWTMCSQSGRILNLWGRASVQLEFNGVTTIPRSSSGFTLSSAMVSIVAEGTAMEIDTAGSKFACMKVAEV